MSNSSSSSVFIRSPFNYSMDSASKEAGQDFPDASLTQQSFKDETDINNIVDRFMKTGVLPDPVRMPQYVDFEGIFDYQTAMNVVRAADENFQRLDSKVRARFHNSPQEFLDFFADPSNKEEAIRLGLVLPSVKQSGDGVPSSEPAPGAGGAAS